MRQFKFIFCIIIGLKLSIYAQPKLGLEAGIYALYQPKKFYKMNQEFFAIPYADFKYHKFHFMGRYNLDLLHTGSLALGYEAINLKNDKLLLIPNIGYAFGNLQGPLLGFQFNVKYKKWQLYGLNNWLIAINNRNLNNWYTWSELNYRFLPCFKAGGSVFLRHFIFTNNLFLDAGIVTIFEIRKVTISTYLMNFWNQKFYAFFGLSYKI